MAAALAAMVAKLTLGKKKYADVQERMRQIAEQADQVRASLEQAVRLDAQAYEGVMAAMRLPKDSDAEIAARTAAIDNATRKATEVPLEVVQQVVTVLELLAEVAETANANAVTDAGSGAAMARAAITAAGLNVRVNAAGIADKAAAQKWLDALKQCETQAQATEARVRAALKSRAGIED
jgi:glutamate formiminotransferase/formiminotetrahydrofolate cyclodeaminase